MDLDSLIRLWDLSQSKRILGLHVKTTSLVPQATIFLYIYPDQTQKPFWIFKLWALGFKR